MEPPLQNWLKVNTDGAFVKTPVKAACGGIFRNSDGICQGCFDQDIPNYNSAFYVEIFAVILAIEIATNNHWKDMWLETDSQLVLLACKDVSMVSWSIRNRWNNCMDVTKNMNVFVSHIYREGNTYTDGLANLCLALSSHVWFPSVPDSIRAEYIRNILGLPNFRFKSF